MNPLELAGIIKLVGTLAGGVLFVSFFMLIIAFIRKKPKKKVVTVLFFSWFINALCSWLSEWIVREVARQTFF